MMTSGSALSPLGFTRDFQHYRARAAAIPYRDTRLLLAAHFWSEHSAALGDPAYESFWREDLPPLLEAAGAPDFHDLLPDELEALAQFIERLPTLGLTSGITPPSLWELAAKKWLYVGEVQRALQALSQTAIGAGVEVEPITSAAGDPCEPHELPQRLLEWHGDRLSASLVEWLKALDSEWRAYLDGGSPNRATCVVVEQDHAGRPLRGRLRVLEGQLERLNNGNGGHQVVFAHQLRSPDDPQIAGAYAALAALANAESGIRKTEWKGPVGKPSPVSWRAGYAFIDAGKELHGGASLAFACFATGFGDLWSKDLHRARKLISHAVVLTGALAPDGLAAPVSAESLARKVERVFFSPLSSLVVPKSNRDAAEAAVTALSQRHPRRRLRIIAIDRAADLAADGNIMIPERVCPAEFALRAAAKYGRNVKVQVPALAVLTYLLLCIIHPPLWIWFDRNPQFIRHTSFGFAALNADSVKVWDIRFPTMCDSTLSTHAVGNLDNDTKNEVVFVLKAPEVMCCSLNTMIFAYDHDGDELFRRQCVIPRQYPGDTSLAQRYLPMIPEIYQLDGQSLIATFVTISSPARCHIKLWNRTGDEVGWYINAGFCGGEDRKLFDPDRRRLHLSAYNNPMNSVALVVLPVDSMRGVSPPYITEEFDLRGCIAGNQIAYIVFPPTDVNRVDAYPYNAPGVISAEGEGLVRLQTGESHRRHGGIQYLLDYNFRLVSVIADDVFWARRDILVEFNELPPIARDEYLDSLAARIQYWAGEGWVRGNELNRQPLQ